MRQIKMFSMLILCLIIVSCNSSIEPESVEGFVTLQVGDIRQFHVVPDDSYIIMEVVEKISRADGKEVFKIVLTYQLPDGLYYGNLNYYIENGYLIRTELNQFPNEQINPFHEEKLAMIWPSDGESFQINEGVEDDNRLYMNVKMIDSLETPIQIFTNVAEYSQFHNDVDTYSRFFYANKFGQIGTFFSNGIDTSKVLLNYIKANQIEAGRFVDLL